MTKVLIDPDNASPAARDQLAEGRRNSAQRELMQSYEMAEHSLWQFQYFELQLIRSQDLQSLLQLLLRDAPQYFGLEGASLHLYDPDASLRELFVESIGVTPERVEYTSQSEDLQALFPGGVKVRAIEPECGGDEIAFPLPSLLLPLVSQGSLTGCLQLFPAAAGDAKARFTDNHLAHFAAVVAICIENCVNRERLRLHSLLDVLTGVRNRRGFEESLEKEISRAMRSGLPLTALFVDLDHFKRVNDRYGHPCGDRVLSAVVNNISEVLRPTDMLSRYGGEEFVALLPDCDDNQAQGIAQRINLSVAALDLYDDHEAVFHLSCSVGYSSWLRPQREDADDISRRLIAMADKAVYRAKQEGRDRACYQPL